MNSIARYSLLMMRPIAERRDMIVVGAIIRKNDDWHVLLTNDGSKILALDPNYPLANLPSISKTITELAQECDNLAKVSTFLNSTRASIFVDSFEGCFAYANEIEYQTQIDSIFAESVHSPIKSIEKTTTRSSSKLRATLKQQFSNLNILGNRYEDIHDHKIISRYPINLEQGLVADFALKNSVMHITETIDFTMSEDAFTAKKYEAQAKCLVLKASLEICGPLTKRYIIIAGGTRKNALSAVNLLQANADLYNFESSSEMSKYLSIIETAANGFSSLH